MIRNALQTDMAESLGLLNMQLILYVLFLGLIPSYIIYKIPLEYRYFKDELFSKIKSILLSLVVITIVIFSFSKFYTSFLREHKPLRYYTNPTYWIYSIGNYINKTLNSGPIIVKPIGLDAKVQRDDNSTKKIIVMVVGEALRADHFGLNSYERNTTPLLERRDDIINFSNFYSCGTSTAHSVPCMFSVLKRDEYSYKKAIRVQNVVDVISHTNSIATIWRDNNSDPKGVMDRLGFENYKNSKTNTINTDGEPRDEGMLIGLNQFIKQNKNKDIFIVLHMMGNHGPEYYKRYPKSFEKYKPVCKTNQLEKCSQQEIQNAYDNAVLYTDYFLNKTLNFLQKYNNSYQTALFYVADHGESLGENGIYLHGMPYFMAPDAQKHVAAFIYTSPNFTKIDKQKLKSLKDKKLSQDNIFSTLLGLFDIKTKVYEKDMDITK
jgi:lipid A ethanolaminephosphotransferase